MRKNNLVILFFLLFSHCVFSSTTKVNLQEGINLIDINNDGIKDLVIKALHDNNTSHPLDTLTIYIHKSSGEYNIVSVPNDAGFIWYDLKMAASALKVSGYELRQDNDRYYMFYAYKVTDISISEDISANLPVKISQYEIIESYDDPGVPAYRWRLVNRYITKTLYEDVDQAFLDMN